MTHHKSFAMSLVAAAALLATSCVTDTDETASNLVLQYESGNISELTPTAPVTVRVNDFAIAIDEYPTAGTRAEDDLATYNNAKAITLAFYDAEGTEKYKHTQLRGDDSTFDTYGEFTCDLPIGSYTMVVLGYGSEQPITLTSPTNAIFDNDRVRETLATTQTVNITTTAAVNLTATLKRVVAKLQVISTDNCSANADNVRVTFSAGGQSFNPSTGLAIANDGFENTVPISDKSGTSKTISYLFLATDEQKINITIDVLDSEGNSISHKEVTNVLFKRNSATKLTGSLYTASGTASFKFEKEWLEDINVPF